MFDSPIFQRATYIHVYRYNILIIRYYVNLYMYLRYVYDLEKYNAMAWVY